MMRRDEGGLAPARRHRGPATAESGQDGFADEELAQGQALAVLGALGRMQLRLDVLAREHAQAMQDIRAGLERLEAAVDDVRRSSAGQQPPPSPPRSEPDVSSATLPSPTVAAMPAPAPSVESTSEIAPAGDPAGWSPTAASAPGSPDPT